MTSKLPEPSDQLSEPRELLLAYLDYYRSAVVAKLDGMSDEALRSSRLPSGWTPIELLRHLVFMEQRWFVWGFAGQDVGEPWGEDGPDGRWHVEGDEPLGDLVDALHRGGEATRSIVEASGLGDLGADTGRFDEGRPPPALVWILLHTLQEYARHAGHLDVVRELVDGETGE